MFYHRTTIIIEKKYYLQLVQKEVDAKEPVYERILQNGKNILDETEPGPEKDAVQGRLDDLTDNWNDVKQKSAKRASDIDQLYPVCQDHFDGYVTFSLYLTDAEKRQQAFEPVPCDKDELERQKKELEVLTKGSVIFSDTISYIGRSLNKKPQLKF